MSKSETVISAASEEKKKKRAIRCMEEIKKVLEKNKCSLVPVVSIVGDTMSSDVQIQPL